MKPPTTPPATPTRIYRPGAGSLAAQVTHFFRGNPEELLTLDDITDKYDCVRGNIHTLLKPAVDAGLLQRGVDEEGAYIYQAGPKLGMVPTTGTPADVAARPNGKPSPRGYTATRKMLNLQQLEVDDNVPFLGSATTGGKWKPLFDKLTRPGLSIALPGDVKAAVAAAAAKINREKTRGAHSVAMTGEGEARIWRIS